MCAIRRENTICFIYKKTRDNSSSGLKYTFVGDAYMQGLMDEEAFDMTENGVLEMQTLILR